MVNYEVVESPDDKQRAYDLRWEVFVVEQGVPGDMELDEFDEGALHVVAKDAEGAVVGTGRLVIEPEDNCGRIGRLAVAKPQRHQDIGTGIMMLLEQAARDRHLSELYLHAQIYAQRFYEQLGYVPRGERFDEAGIEHIEMFKQLKPNEMAS